MPLASFLRRVTGKPAPTTKDNLFPVVQNPEEECIRDCNACPGYGRAFDKIGIDDRSDLYGAVNQYSTHVIVATGQTDWIRDVVEIPGSVMAGLQEERELIKNGRLMISASNIPRPNEHEHDTTPSEATTPTGDSATVPDQPPTTCIVLPSFTVVENVTKSSAAQLISQFINPGPTTEMPISGSKSSSAAGSRAPSSRNSLDGKSKTPNGSNPSTPTIADAPTEALAKLSVSESGFRSYPYPHDYLILICSHRHRDARCGISAPILKKEFEKHLRPLGLWRDLDDRREGGASVVFVNHVGGHKYAANVIIYRKSDGQGIWLGRVTPQHVLGIVKHTVLEGKVVDKTMVRGGFNRREGSFSW